MSDHNELHIFSQCWIAHGVHLIMHAWALHLQVCIKHGDSNQVIFNYLYITMCKTKIWGDDDITGHIEEQRGIEA